MNHRFSKRCTSAFAFFLAFVPSLLLPCSVAAQEHPAVLIQQGERYLALGKPEAALSRYAKVLQCCGGTPYAAEAHNDMGVALMRMGEEEEAREHYILALEINRYPLALFNLARLLEQRWQREGAAEQRLEALKLYTEFSAYLDAEEDLPPSVQYQLGALREHLRDALAGLKE